jgi:hypothetical protein
VENPELKHLENRRHVLYDNLKDLQFEYHQGKLTDEDYQSLKQKFLYDLAGIMDSIERIGPSPEGKAGPRRKIEPRIVPGGSESALPRPHAPAGQTVCPACKSSNPSGNRFCGQCGQSL